MVRWNDFAETVRAGGDGAAGFARASAEGESGALSRSFCAKVEMAEGCVAEVSEGLQ